MMVWLDHSSDPLVDGAHLFVDQDLSWSGQLVLPTLAVRFLQFGDLIGPLEVPLSHLSILFLLDVVAEDQSIGGSAKSKVAKFVSLVDMLTLINACVDTRDLGHSDFDDGDVADVLVVGLDDVDLPDRDSGQQGLGVDVVVLADVDPLARVLQVVGPARLVAVPDGACDGGLPPVVAPRVQERLEDGSFLESGLDEVDKASSTMVLLLIDCVKHVDEGVLVVLEPEGCVHLDVVGRVAAQIGDVIPSLWQRRDGVVEGEGVRTAQDHVLVVVNRHLVVLRFELPSKPVHPAFKAIVWQVFWITLEAVVVHNVLSGLCHLIIRNVRIFVLIEPPSASVCCQVQE